MTIGGSSSAPHASRSSRLSSTPRTGSSASPNLVAELDDGGVLALRVDDRDGLADEI